MEIRHATKHDISAISEVEAKCFPPSEAASEKAFTGRIENYGNHFWLMYENDKLIAFVDGFVTDESDLKFILMHENAHIRRCHNA